MWGVWTRGWGGLGPYRGHKAIHTCTSWYAYAAMFGSSIIIGLGHKSVNLQIRSCSRSLLCYNLCPVVFLSDCRTVFCQLQMQYAWYSTVRVSKGIKGCGRWAVHIQYGPKRGLVHS